MGEDGNGVELTGKEGRAKERFFIMYKYLGDKMTDAKFKGALCEAVRKPNGKCIRGRNSNMLVRFTDGTTVVILARLLRKVKVYRKYIGENNSGKMQNIKPELNCLVLRFNGDDQDYICQYMNSISTFHLLQFEGYTYPIQKFLN